MSLLVIKIVSGFIMAITNFLMVRNLIQKRVKLMRIDSIFSIFLIVLPTIFFYEVKYNFLVALLVYIISVLVFKRVFKISYSSSLFAVTIVMFITALIDGILSSFELHFFTYDQVRNIWYINIANNCVICFVSFLISKIRFFSNKFQTFCMKVDQNRIRSSIFFAIGVVIIMTLLFYNVTTIFQLNLPYTITLIAMLLITVLYFIFIGEKNNYQKLSNEYNILFDYVQNFENWIDDERMYRHELKNNLSIIRSMTSNKKVINKIDDMLKVSIIVDEQYIEDLKNVPKGGLKGLLYYKIAIAKNEGVKIITEVSPKVTIKIKKLSEKHLRQLSIVLGIYLDNAIEAAKESNKKEVTLEIYTLKSKIYFVISNTYKGEIQIGEIGKKGYSTKGNGHGNGLYYASKTIGKADYLSTESSLLNDFFIQKLIVE